jgi:hypothetical protein
LLDHIIHPRIVYVTSVMHNKDNCYRRLVRRQWGLVA